MLGNRSLLLVINRRAAGPRSFWPARNTDRPLGSAFAFLKKDRAFGNGVIRLHSFQLGSAWGSRRFEEFVNS